LENSKIAHQDQNTGRTAADAEAVEASGTAAAEQPAGGAADGRLDSLQALLAGRETELGEARKSLGERQKECDALRAGYEEAVTAYRRLAVSSNPLLSDELITGSTIAEVDASLARAAGFIGKIRSRIEEDLKNLAVPAGAPERSAPDTSGLSPREKIAEGVKKQNK